MEAELTPEEIWTRLEATGNRNEELVVLAQAYFSKDRKIAAQQATIEEPVTLLSKRITVSYSSNPQDYIDWETEATQLIAKVRGDKQPDQTKESKIE